MTDLMQAVSSFSFNSNSFDVYLTADKTPAFLANQVCAVLDFGNPRDAIDRHVDEDDVWKTDIIDSLGRIQKANFINESGLYALIFGSKKPQAKEFKHWVTSEVLPAIRKTGSYAVRPSEWTQVADDTEAYRRICIAMNNTSSMAAANTAQFISREHGKDVKHLLTTNVSDTQDMLLTPTQIGSHCGLSAIAMNRRLAKEGLQEKSGDKWTPTEKGKDYCQVLDVGKKRSDGTPIQQVKWYKSKVIDLIKKL